MDWGAVKGWPRHGRRSWAWRTWKLRLYCRAAPTPDGRSRTRALCLRCRSSSGAIVPLMRPSLTRFLPPACVRASGSVHFPGPASVRTGRFPVPGPSFQVAGPTTLLVSFALRARCQVQCLRLRCSAGQAVAFCGLPLPAQDRRQTPIACPTAALSNDNMSRQLCAAGGPVDHAARTRCGIGGHYVARMSRWNAAGE